jgi:hypothetical protein
LGNALHQKDLYELYAQQDYYGREIYASQHSKWQPAAHPGKHRLCQAAQDPDYRVERVWIHPRQYGGNDNDPEIDAK